MLHTPVLIVGGSLVGLSASLFLAWRGVPHTLIDKHPGSSPHPRAMGFTETTLEHFRAVGIADRIPQTPPGTRLRRVNVHSLAGRWSHEQPWTPGEAPGQADGLSPCTGAAIAQDRLEPILREATVERGAVLRLGTELLTLEQHAHGAVAQVRNRADGSEHAISTDYVVAADGAGSRIREALGIARSGVGHLRVLRSVLFRCPGADAYLAHGAQQFAIAQEDFHAFLTTYGDSRWVLMFEDDQERTEDELHQAIRRALGADLPFTLLTTGRWEMAGRIADRYRQGRIFLAGDAAHQLPPTRGGFGANTGIGDAWNLAWKLQRVLQGTSHPGLLDTYESERRPIAWLRHQQTFSRPDYAAWAAGTGFVPEPLHGSDAMEFGQLARSAAILGAGPELPAAAPVARWSGQPGTRAPHVWVQCSGERISTLDLLGKDFVLLTASTGWLQAGRALDGLQAVQVGHGGLCFPAEQPFEATFGLAPGGAVLVRPDGIIAWRGPQTDGPQDAAQQLHTVMAQVA